MPRKRSTTTTFTSLSETPLIVCELLIQRITPAMKVELPSVAISESMSISTTSAPLIRPTASPTPSAARIDAPIDQPWFTFRIASVIADSPIVAATDRS